MRTAWHSRLWALLAACACLWPLAARADVWGYVDDDGMTHFADRKVDERYQLYFKTSHLQFDARKVMLAQERAGRRGSSVGGLHFNPASDAAAGAKARRLAAMIDQSRAYQAASPHLRREAERNGLDLQLVKAIVAAESGFNTTAVSSAGAVGLMQIMPATARDLGVRDDKMLTVEQKLTDPSLNVKLGTRYLKYLVNRFSGRLDLAVAAYNAGHGAVQRAGNAVPNYAETQNYVRTVLALYQTMQPGASAAASYASAYPAAAGRSGKSGGRGRVSMTIAGGKPAPGGAAATPVAELSLAPAQLAGAGAPGGPSAMDTVATKLAEADAEITTLDKDVFVKTRTTPAPPPAAAVRSP